MLLINLIIQTNLRDDTIVDKQNEGNLQTCLNVRIINYIVLLATDTTNPFQIFMNLFSSAEGGTPKVCLYIKMNFYSCGYMSLEYQLSP